MADCVLGVARLISSARQICVKIGPRWNSNTRLPSGVSMTMLVPRMSAGIRSGVNWMREKSRSSASASVRTSSVLPRPGHPFEQAMPADEQAGQHAVDDLVVADDHPPNCRARRANGRETPHCRVPWIRQYSCSRFLVRCVAMGQLPKSLAQRIPGKKVRLNKLTKTRKYETSREVGGNHRTTLLMTSVGELKLSSRPTWVRVALRYDRS